jgi:hypothetical protein
MRQKKNVQGRLCTQVEAKYTALVRNIGTRAAAFVARAGPPFGVRPSEGVLEAGGMVQVRWGWALQQQHSSSSFAALTCGRWGWGVRVALAVATVLACRKEVTGCCYALLIALCTVEDGLQGIRIAAANLAFVTVFKPVVCAQLLGRHASL